MYIDIGVNFTNKRFHKDLSDVLERAEQAGVSHMIVTGTSLPASIAAVKLVQRIGNMLSATAGVHPHDAKTWSDQHRAELSALLKSEDVVAVGECGLDFNRNFSSREDQISCFEAQLELAKHCQKPLFLHERDAFEVFESILRTHQSGLPGSVVHCFTGTLEQARTYLDMGCYLGVTGWLNDSRRGAELRELIKFVPHDRIMIETDAPFLLPGDLPFKVASRRNEPAFLPYIFDLLASILGQPKDRLREQIFANSVAFFGTRVG